MCGNMADIQSSTAEIRRGKKKERKKERRTNDRMKIYMAINNVYIMQKVK